MGMWPWKQPEFWVDAVKAIFAMINLLQWLIR